MRVANPGEKLCYRCGLRFSTSPINLFARHDPACLQRAIESDMRRVESWPRDRSGQRTLDGRDAAGVKRTKRLRAGNSQPPLNHRVVRASTGYSEILSHDPLLCKTLTKLPALHALAVGRNGAAWKKTARARNRGCGCAVEGARLGARSAGSTDTSAIIPREMWTPEPSRS